MGDELKPCPFCGYEPKPIKHNGYPDGFDNWIVQCERCNIIIVSNDEQKAIGRWNNRLIEDALRGELDKAKGALEYAQSYWMQAIEQRDTLQGKLNEQQEWINKLEKAVDDACQKICSIGGEK